MHEIALAQGVLEVALDVADGHEVRTVRVRAGELMAVTQDSFQFCFEMVAQDTLAAAARLDLEIVPGDVLLVDGVELDDGWRWHPDLVVTEAEHEHEGVAS
jgi:Zn finger protein HypA/HybF involved in hydrogenase expression